MCTSDGKQMLFKPSIQYILKCMYQNCIISKTALKVYKIIIWAVEDGCFF